MANKFGAFLFGGVVGAIAALLCAPRSGEETRAMVADKANTVWGEAQDWGAQAGANAQQVYQQAAAKGQQVVEDVTTKGQAIASDVA